MKFRAHHLASIALCTPTALAGLTTIHATSDIAYAIGAPSNTLATGSGAVYLSASFPASSYAYVALGLGTHMASATIFAVYTDGAGNVTVSARAGADHVQPLADAAAQGRVTLLAGSTAAKGGNVTANWRYVASAAELGGGAEAPFIASWKKGGELGTRALDAQLVKHDAHAVFEVELGKADVGAEGNPFWGTAAGKGEGEGQGEGDEGGQGEGEGEGAGGVEIEEVMQLIARTKKFAMAHGALMGVAWLVLIPLGAMLMRAGVGGVWTHAALQTLGLAMIVAGFAVGYDLAREMHLLFNTTHTIFGAAIFALVLAQPVLGLVHHARFRSTGQATGVGLVHRWYGRALVVMAVVNGGLGLQLAANTTGGVVAYAVVAGVVAVVYAMVLGCTAVRRRRQVKVGR